MEVTLYEPGSELDAWRYIPTEYVGKLEPNYYCRAWNGKRHKYCKARAGAGTVHFGEGRCWIHGGIASEDDNRIRSGHRVSVTTRRIAELVHDAEQEDPTDMVQAIDRLKALARFVEEHFEELAEALLAWNADKEKHERPARVPDLDALTKTWERSARVTDMYVKQLQSDAIKKLDFIRVMKEMGEAVKQEVDADTARKIMKRWDNLAFI